MTVSMTTDAAVLAVLATGLAMTWRGYTGDVAGWSTTAQGLARKSTRAHCCGLIPVLAVVVCGLIPMLAVVACWANPARAPGLIPVLTSAG